ncbi:thiol-disulfide oxidoreductase DCC family protein [Fibrella sp. HMF5335]|uniref:Thiol-disulfide oxidoreductase DCC family protein n=1 Tax=Fibrella rubiginis TaxID=2817060 RepID=A0A939GEZ1_9BACT|nr:thiol-disulfide oxidoreductase DCC family protein [Fibrella rubiginis]MBO0935312.1 thiol-disulfide oxidoreductase DCC family protein [Fibrella rubiginis]
MNSNLLLFDGVCNLCNGVVQFVIRHDPAGRFRFAALQSDAGQTLLQQFGLSTTQFDSFVYVRDGRFYTESTAALRVARDMGGAMSLLWGLMIVPRFIRDAVYRLVARNRYRVFGKQDACMIPTPELKSRFL